MNIIKEGDKGQLYRGTCNNCSTEIECTKGEIYEFGNHIFISNCPHCKCGDRVYFEQYPPVSKFSYEPKGMTFDAVTMTILVLFVIVLGAIGMGYLLTHNTVYNYKQNQIEQMTK